MAADPEKEMLNGLADLLRSLRVVSTPLTRVADHLLRIDLNEVYHFAYANPDLVRPARLRKMAA